MIDFSFERATFEKYDLSDFGWVEYVFSVQNWNWERTTAETQELKFSQILLNTIDTLEALNSMLWLAFAVKVRVCLCVVVGRI